MITREELEKMIENGEMVWMTKDNSIPYGVKLGRGDYATDEYLNYGVGIVFIKNVYKTKEDAEWIAAKCAKREERFEPLHWDEIDKSSPWKYTFSVPKPCCRGNIIVNHIIVVHWGYTGYCEGQESFGVATQKNYEKAVDFARKLFLGEEN